MYIITREIQGTKEILKDSNKDSIKKFTNLSSASNFVTKLNFHMQPDKQWYVESVKFHNLKMFPRQNGPIQAR